MAKPDKQVDVLIVGAGPAGLMLAAQLLRYGVHPTIIDSRPGPEKRTNAMMLQAGSLELFRQLGMADSILDKGVHCYGMHLQNTAGKRAIVDFSRIDSPTTPFPFVLDIGQDQVVRQLIDRLTGNVCPVIWDTELTAVQQDDHSVQVKLLYRGEKQTWVCNWVVGADGAASRIRQQLHIPVEMQRQQRFLMADLLLPDLADRNIHIALLKSGILGFFPLPDRGCFRLLFSLPAGISVPEDRLDLLVNTELANNWGIRLPEGAWLWSAVLETQRQTAGIFAQQRCFLIGDAAHTYSPIGSHGMNAGLHDAANLGWKLAGVVRGKMGPGVLASYSYERLTLAHSFLATVDRVFGLLTASGRFARAIRDRLFLDGIRLLQQKGGTGFLFDSVAQLGVNYRKSGLSAHHAGSRHVQAGDRLPFLSVYNEKNKTETDLHRWCEKPGFGLLILGTIDHHQLHIIGRWMHQKYPREMHLYYLPYSARNQLVFDRFELRPTGTRIILIRPDRYIGYMNDALNVGLIDTYMEEVIGWK